MTSSCPRQTGACGDRSPHRSGRGATQRSTAGPQRFGGPGLLADHAARGGREDGQAERERGPASTLVGGLEGLDSVDLAGGLAGLTSLLCSAAFCAVALERLPSSAPAP